MPLDTRRRNGLNHRLSPRQFSDGRNQISERHGLRPGEMENPRMVGLHGLADSDGQIINPHGIQADAILSFDLDNSPCRHGVNQTIDQKTISSWAERMIEAENRRRKHVPVGANQQLGTCF